MLLTDEDLALPLDELKNKIEQNYPDYCWYTFKGNKKTVFAKFNTKFPSDNADILIYSWEELLQLPKEELKIYFMTNEEFYNLCKTKRNIR